MSDGTTIQGLTIWVHGIWSPSMKTGALIQLILSHFCHPKLLADCTVLDRKIGVGIATLNAIGSLLDSVKWWNCTLRNLLFYQSIWIFILPTLPLSSTPWISPPSNLGWTIDFTGVPRPLSSMLITISPTLVNSTNPNRTSSALL